MALILGSGSPRRWELLAQIGVVADAVRPPDIDETPSKSELARPYCVRMAREKVWAVEADETDIVLSADTTVSAGRRILGKPENIDEARQFLTLLSGRRHRVITAVAVRHGKKIWERDVVSTVQMKRLSDLELRAYLATNDWDGKAGGYSIQGPAGAFIPWIKGSYTAIVGLPLAETAGMLQSAGFPIYKDTA